MRRRRRTLATQTKRGWLRDATPTPFVNGENGPTNSQEGKEDAVSTRGFASFGRDKQNQSAHKRGVIRKRKRLSCLRRESKLAHSRWASTQVIGGRAHERAQSARGPRAAQPVRADSAAQPNIVHCAFGVGYSGCRLWHLIKRHCVIGQRTDGPNAAKTTCTRVWCTEVGGRQMCRRRQVRRGTRSEVGGGGAENVRGAASSTCERSRTHPSCPRCRPPRRRGRADAAATRGA